jgi:peptide/nickel transport system ATP-binding protein
MTLSKSAAAPVSEVVLEAVGLTKHFPVRRRLRDIFSGESAAVHAVDDVNLTLRRGMVTALVGESGSGKSTVARLLAQLYPRTAGDIKLHGRTITVRGGRHFRAYARRVQMIFQDPFASLNPVHTVRYHLTRSLKIHGNAGRGAKELERALENLLQRVSLAPAERYLDKFPHELSGGQRQRIAIARALCRDPRLIVCDEPVSALDLSTQARVLDLFIEIQERTGVAYLFVTHDLSVVRRISHRVAVMHQGRIVETGDAAAVTTSPEHPYTKRLLLAAPVPDPARQAERRAERHRLAGLAAPA